MFRSLRPTDFKNEQEREQTIPLRIPVFSVVYNITSMEYPYLGQFPWSIMHTNLGFRKVSFSFMTSLCLGYQVLEVMIVPRLISERQSEWSMICTPWMSLYILWMSLYIWMFLYILWMSLYILIYYYVTIYVGVPHFYDLSALVGCWFSVSIRRIIYKFLNVCPFEYMAVAVSGKVGRP